MIPEDGSLLPGPTIWEDEEPLRADMEGRLSSRSLVCTLYTQTDQLVSHTYDYAAIKYVSFCLCKGQQTI